VATLPEIIDVLGEPQFNWSDPAPWIEVEQEFGIQFPVDFREVVNAYGSVVINGQLHLRHPAGSLGEKIREDLEFWREEDATEFLPSEVGVNSGELMPVASGSATETVFLRVPDGPSSPWHVVVQEFDSFSWVLYEMTFSDWLLAYLRGEDMTVYSSATDRAFFASES